MRRASIIIALCLSIVPLGWGCAWAVSRTAPPTAAPAMRSADVRSIHADILLGDNALERQTVQTAPGVASAFAFIARTSGSTSSVSLFVSPGNRAKTILVGLYSVAGGHPGSRLAVGTISAPRAGQWNRAAVRSAAVKSGETYWLALLGRGGALRLRVRNAGRQAQATSACSGLSSKTQSLDSLPRLWGSARRLSGCSVSGVVMGKPTTVGKTATVATLQTGTASGPATPTGTGASLDVPTTAVTVPLLAPINTAAPSVSGTATQGQTLATSNGSWLDSPTSYAYQWEDCSSSGSNCAHISGATSHNYALSVGDVGHTIRAIVTATNGSGSASATSSASGVVAAAPAPAAPVSSGAPVVSGTAQEGDTLTTSNGSWSNAPSSFAYQWEDCDGSGASCTAISGARSSSYALGSGDVGHTVRSVVTGSNAGGSGSATSGATGVVSAPSAPPPPPPSGAAIYVAQNAAGSGNGADCSDAKPVSFFNTTSNWGSASGQIGPGVTVELCGTITSQLMAHGSGTTSSPITVQWTSGATLSEPVCPGTGCFDTNNQTDLTLNGGSNGSIQSTANGTGLAHQTSGVDGIYAAGCTGCTFENLLIENMYVHTSTSDTAIDGSENQGIFISGSNINILNNTIHDVGWAILSQFRNGDGNVTISNNNIYDIDHGFALTGTGGGITIGTVVFSHNNVHDFANWDTNAADAYHHDGVHCFTGYTGSYAHLTGVYIDDNTFGGQTGYNMNAMIFLEGGQGSGYTPCGDSTSKIYIFNNVFSDSGQIADGFLALYSTSPQIYNNTMMGYSSTSSGSNCIIHEPSANYATTAESFENNVISDCDNEIGASTGRYASGQPDYNIYAQGGSNAFGCNTNDYAFSQFSSWKSCIGGDSHSSTTSNALLNSNGSPQSGSPATAAGNNLTSLCTGNLTPLCTEINGTPRPTTGAWDTGAY
jgi:hypothetical protein